MARSCRPCNLRFQGQFPFSITAYDDYQLERASNANTKTLFIKMLFEPRDFQGPGSPDIFRVGLTGELANTLIFPIDEEGSDGLI